MATSCTDCKHPYYEQLKGKDFQEAIEFFSGENAYRMRFVSLGEALDFISFGGVNFVCWSFNVKNLTKFIRTWMREQEPRIEYERKPLGEGISETIEKKREKGYLWNKFCSDFSINKLPRINYEKCPRNESHEETLIDRGGRIRCKHVDKKYLKPSWIREFKDLDRFSFIEKNDLWEDVPHESYFYYDDEDNIIEDPEESEEYDEYLKELEEFVNEKPIEIIHPCYAIIKEPKEVYLQLETILKRLNCSFKSSKPDGISMYPFSGFTLANYVKAWHEQPGRKKVWNGKPDFYKEFPNFMPITSDE